MGGIEKVISDEFKRRLDKLQPDISLRVMIKGLHFDRSQTFSSHNEKIKAVVAHYTNSIAPINKYLKQNGVSPNLKLPMLGAVIAELSGQQICELAMKDYVSNIVEDCDIPVELASEGKNNPHFSYGRL